MGRIKTSKYLDKQAEETKVKVKHWHNRNLDVGTGDQEMAEEIMTTRHGSQKDLREDTRRQDSNACCYNQASLILNN